MDMEDMVPEEEPFTWSVPINVLPVTHSYKSATVEAVACLGASIEDKALLDDDFF